MDLIVKRSLFSVLLACILVLLLFSSVYGDSRIRCQSLGYRYSFCPVDVRRGGVHLINELSDSRCVYGHSWGFNNVGLWVDRGCRGIFEVRGGRNHSDYRPRPSYNWGYGAVKPRPYYTSNNRPAQCWQRTGGCPRPEWQNNNPHWGVGHHRHSHCARLKDGRCIDD